MGAALQFLPFLEIEEGQLEEASTGAAGIACKRLTKIINAGGCNGSNAIPEWQNKVSALLLKLVAKKSVPALKLVSAFALHSLETNKALAAQQELISALVGCLAKPGSLKSVKACANAISDLATSEDGSQALLSQGAVPELLDCLGRPVPASTSEPQIRKGKRKQIGPPALDPTVFPPLLDALFALLFCTAAPAIHELPRGKCPAALAALKSAGRDAAVTDELSSEQRGRLCAVTARLAVGRDPSDVSSRVADVSTGEADVSSDCARIRDLLGVRAEGLGAFLADSWERQPAFFPADGSSAAYGKGATWPLAGVKGLGGLDEFFKTVLENAVGCPSPAAEEHDVIKSLRDASRELGAGLLYGRDITLVKTVERKLLHFGRSSVGTNTSVQAVEELVTETGSGDQEGARSVTAAECREGFEQGFSVAVRGLQCRLPEVARLADEMSTALGQASVGVNAYLTPANSQGLAAHYDDHCVFVCQLAGHKTWRVYEPRKSERLPRLYAPRGEPELAGRVCRVYELVPGDVLYIPRGWTHVATALGEGSMHVTFGVEVESPFSWEGFLRTALRSAHDATAPALPDGDESDESSALGSPRGKAPSISRVSLLPTMASDGLQAETARNDAAVEAPRGICRCYEVVSLLADSIPELRKACLLGAVFSNRGNDATCSSPTNCPATAHPNIPSARNVVNIKTSKENPGASVSEGKDQERTAGYICGRKAHRPGQIDSAFSAVKIYRGSSSGASLTGAVLREQFEALLEQVRARMCADQGEGPATLQGDGSEETSLVKKSGCASGSPGGLGMPVHPCWGCFENVSYNTTKKVYMNELRRYQNGRREWAQAMIAI